MRLYIGMPKIKGPSILCLGIFDGVHLGHRAILQNAMKLREKEFSPVIVYTFQNRPAEVLRGAAANLLSNHMQKTAILKRLGVDGICFDYFNKETAQIEALDWLDSFCKAFQPEHIFTGYNYSFGRMGKGNNQLLKEMEGRYGYKLHIMPEVMNNGQDVSSTRIRNLLLAGEIANANLLLGYFYTAPMQFVWEDEEHLYLQSLGKNIVPAVGKYAVTLRRRLEGKPFQVNTVLHIRDSIYIKKSNFSNQDLFANEKVAIRFSHRL